MRKPWKLKNEERTLSFQNMVLQCANYLIFLFLFLIFFLDWCAGWGYTVAFTQILTAYQIYHSWIHPLHRSSLSPPISWNSFNRSHFCICIHVYTFFCTIFILLHPFPASSPLKGPEGGLTLEGDLLWYSFICLKSTPTAKEDKMATIPPGISICGGRLRNITISWWILS
jgi:hypothetical protein